MVHKDDLSVALQLVWHLADENPDSKTGRNAQALNTVGHFIQEVFVDDRRFSDFVD